MATNYETKLKKLLSNKKSMGGDKYAAAIGKLKKDMKADNAGSFRKLLKNVKGQEREGKFDRGAEGKTKKKLRAKLHKEHQMPTHGAQHKGTKADKITEKYKDIDPGQKKHIQEVKDELGIKKIKKGPNGRSR